MEQGVENLLRDSCGQAAVAKNYWDVEQFGSLIFEKLKDMDYWRSLEACRSKSKELQTGEGGQ